MAYVLASGGINSLTMYLHTAGAQLGEFLPEPGGLIYRSS
jgi:hypothetical protein